MTTDEKINKLVSEPNYHTIKRFSENLLAMEVTKKKSKKNKSVYLGMSILDISKMLMYKFWYDYIKPKYEDRANLCYTDTDDTSNYDKNDKRPLPKGKNKKIIEMFKDELGEKIIKEFCALRGKTYPYLMGHDIEVQKAKGTKKCVIKREPMFEN